MLEALTLEALQAKNAALEEEVAKLQKVVAYKEDEVERLKRQIKALRAKIFSGSKSEKIDREQLLLELQELEDQLIQAGGTVSAPEGASPANPVRRPRREPRHPFPEEIEEIEETIVPDEVKADPEAYEEIGNPEITETLDVIPMRFIKRRTIRPKFRRKDDRSQAPIVARIVPRILSGGLPAIGLLVQILLGKYVDHQPLYRMEQTFKRRCDVRISRKTMADWVRSVAEDWLALIYYSIKSDLLSKPYLHADETPITCNDPDTKGRSRKGYLWVYADREGQVFFDWHMSRAHGCALEMLGGFRGLLQCDAYAAYDAVSAKEGFLLIACMAHIRRKFKEAWDVGEEQTSAWYLLQISKLYGHEKDLREQQADPLLWRKTHCLPLLQEFKKHLEEELPKMSKDSKMYKAAQYALKNYDKMKRYIYYPDACIDNNPVEQAIRPTKLGMKNWLFVGHPQAGRRSAIIYTIVENCKNLGINPQAYLTDVLQRLPNMSSHPEAIKALVPKNWKPLE